VDLAEPTGQACYDKEEDGASRNGENMAAVDVIAGTAALAFAGFFVYRSFRKTARGCHCDGACQTRSRPDDVVDTPKPRA
jgi:hypothetical protein